MITHFLKDVDRTACNRSVMIGSKHVTAHRGEVTCKECQKALAPDPITMAVADTNEAARALYRGARYCYYIPADAYIAEHGFRVSYVIEGVSGHYPIGTWPYTGAANEMLPWFWGHEYRDALATCAEVNKERGLSPQDVAAIITSSMQAQNAEDADAR